MMLQSPATTRNRSLRSRFHSPPDGTPAGAPACGRSGQTSPSSPATRPCRVRAERQEHGGISGLLVVLIGCLAVAGPARAATHVVNVEDNRFTPSQLTICLGDTVRWEWVGVMGHTATSGDGCGGENGAWDSGLLTTGASFSMTFSSIPPECATDDSAGDNTCSYFCIPHCSNMTGVITIADNPVAGLGLSRNKLRVTRDATVGRGGTTLGVAMLDGASYQSVLPGTTRLTLTLTAPGLPGPISSTIPLEDGRRGWSARLPGNEAQQLDIQSASLVAREPDIAKFKVGWETNGFDLNAVGALTLTVEIEQQVPSACGGTATVVATDSSVVAK